MSDRSTRGPAADDPLGIAEDLLADDAHLAAAVAHAAGQALLGLRDGWSSDDPRALKDEGDRLGHTLITATLAAYRPDDVVLSEEGRDDRTRLSADRVWIVDPLDGTREFAEPPRDDWAIHVALWERFPVGHPDRLARGAGPGGDGRGRTGDLTAAAVSLPARGVTLTTYDEPFPVAGRSARPRVLVSRTRPPPEAERVAEAIGADLVAMGSAGAKATAVLLGDGDVYVHSGGQYEWDSAAPVAVCRAAGLFCRRIDGSELVYNQPDLSLPDLVVCRPDLADAVMAALADTNHTTDGNDVR